MKKITDIFKTYDEAQSAWDDIKDDVKDDFDDPEGEDEDMINRITDDEFYNKYGFNIFDYK